MANGAKTSRMVTLDQKTQCRAGSPLIKWSDDSGGNAIDADGQSVW